MDDSPHKSEVDSGTVITHERVGHERDKYLLIAIDDIEPNPYQYREDWGDLPALAKSIEKNGLITTPIGRPNPGTRGKPYQLAAGERRLRATKIAGLAHIPLIVRPMGDDEMIEVLFQENLNRKDTTPLEEARGFKAALDRAYTVEQLMTKTGKSRGYVYGRMKLLELAPYAMKALQSGDLPATHAELIARIADRDAQERCTKEVLGKIDNEIRDDLARIGVEHESLAKPDATSEDLSGFPPRTPQLLSFRATKDLIRRRYMTRLATASFEPNDASLLPSAGACTPCAFRAANQPALPGLVEAGKGDDTCTKPSCFEAKTSAAFKREAARAADRGVKVLASANDTRLVFGHNATEVMHASPYVDPTAKMPAAIARAGASQSWAKALGKSAVDVPRVLVQDGTGAPRELLDRDAAVEVLRELGKIDKPTKPPTKAKSTKKKDDKEEREQELKEQAFVRVLGQIADCAATDAKLDAGAGELALWKWMAFAITSVGASHSDAWEMVAGRRGLKLKKGEQWIEWESLQKAIRDSKSVRELRSLVVEILVATLDVSESGLAIATTGAAEQAFKSALKLFDADWSEAMASAKAAAKAEERAADLAKIQKKLDVEVEKIKKAPKKATKKLVGERGYHPPGGRWVNDYTWEDERGIGYIGSTIPAKAHKSKAKDLAAIATEKKLEGLAAIAKKEKCGVRAGGRGRACDQAKGHAGNHSSKLGGTWGDPKPKKTTKVAGPDTTRCSERHATGGRCFLKPGHDGAHDDANWKWETSAEGSPRVTLAKPVLDGTRCTAWNETYGQCELAQAHGGDHELHTPQKSLLRWLASPPLTRAMDGKDCGASARHGADCILDADHGGRHDNGSFTWADRKKKGGK